MLTPEHQAELSAAIDPAVIAERGYVSIGPEVRDGLEKARFPMWAIGPDSSYPGLFIPMYRVTGEHVTAEFKPAVPPMNPANGKELKYVRPRNTPNTLDVHPRNRQRVQDVTVPLWITEGIKKGDALTSRGQCVVTLTGVYNWRSKSGTLGDWEDVPLRGRQVIVCFDSDARTNENVLRAMRRLGAWLESKGVGEVLYLIVPQPHKGVDDYLAAGGEIDGLNEHVSRTVPVTSVVSDPSFTDAYLADTVADDALNGRFLYVPGLGGWQHWDGKRWERCGTELVVDEIRTYVIGQHNGCLNEYARQPGDPKIKKKLDGWRSALSRSKLVALESLCRGIAIADARDFDRHPDLLNAGNGVVDLVTGELLEHDPELRLTKLAPANYARGAEHPDWKASLQAIPEEVHDWYQLRMGQAVTGYAVPDDVMVVQTGGGENGKSGMLFAIGRTLGDYFTLVAHRALLGSADNHPTELMEFRGCRLALVEETPEERRLNVTRLKQVVGTPKITARYIRADSVTFDATHSLFLSTNFPPIVDETDHGTWRRLARLDFPYKWLKPGQALERPNDRVGDPGLRQRLADGQSGQHDAILAWLVAGSVAWYAADRVMPPLPPKVETDTRDWRGETDHLSGYLADRIELEPDSWISTHDLLTDFNWWMKDRNSSQWSERTMISRLRAMDLPNVVKKQFRATHSSRSRPPSAAYDQSSGVIQGWQGVRFTNQ